MFHSLKNARLSRTLREARRRRREEISSERVGATPESLVAWLGMACRDYPEFAILPHIYNSFHNLIHFHSGFLFSLLLPPSHRSKLQYVTRN